MGIFFRRTCLPLDRPRRVFVSVSRVLEDTILSPLLISPSRFLCVRFNWSLCVPVLLIGRDLDFSPVAVFLLVLLLLVALAADDRCSSRDARDRLSNILLAS